MIHSVFSKWIFLASAAALFMVSADLGAARAANLPKNVAIGTTSVGSAPYVVSVGIADLITKKTGISATAESSGGSDAIANLLRTGNVQLAILNTFAAEHAFKGNLEFAKVGKIPVRAIMWGNDSLREPVVRKDSGIKTIADFKGKRILGIRTVAKDTEVVFWGLLKAYGLSTKEVKVLTYSKPKEIMDDLKAGTADGAIWPASAPNPLILELQEAVDLSFPSIPKDKWDAVLDALGPAFFMSTLKPNTYKNQPEEVYVPSIQEGLCTTKDFSDEAVYLIAKALFSNYDELKAVHPSARDWNVKKTLQQFCVPFHKGAIRYFKEIGAWTPQMEKKQQALLALEGK